VAPVDLSAGNPPNLKREISFCQFAALFRRITDKEKVLDK
jgi:hypothetical protein